MSPPRDGWRDWANCVGTDSETFYPEKGGSTAAAKRICGRCEVKADCLSYALANDERFGVWGGESERARRRLQGKGPYRDRLPREKKEPKVLTDGTPSA